MAVGILIDNRSNNINLENTDSNGIIGDSTNALGTYCYNSFVLGGASNDINGDNSTKCYRSAIIGGYNNYIYNVKGSVALGGNNNQCYSNYSVVIGNHAVANKSDGELCIAGTNPTDGSRGMAQTSIFTRHVTTTNNTATTLFDVPVATNSTNLFSVHLVARRTDASNEGASWRIYGTIEEDSGISLIETPLETIISDDSSETWGASFSAISDPSNALRLQVTGENSKTINWVARFDWTQCAEGSGGGSGGSDGGGGGGGATLFTPMPQNMAGWPTQIQVVLGTDWNGTYGMSEDTVIILQSGSSNDDPGYSSIFYSEDGTNTLNTSTNRIRITFGTYTYQTAFLNATFAGGGNGGGYYYNVGYNGGQGYQFKDIFNAFNTATTFSGSRYWGPGGAFSGSGYNIYNDGVFKSMEGV